METAYPPTERGVDAPGADQSPSRSAERRVLREVRLRRQQLMQPDGVMLLHGIEDVAL
jgi:hypothetical protein